MSLEKPELILQIRIVREVRKGAAVGCPFFLLFFKKNNILIMIS